LHTLITKSRAKVAVSACILLTACGGAKGKDANSASTDTSSASAEPIAEKLPPKPPEEESKSKASMCTGSDVDLASALIQVACEVPADQASAMRDLKGQLDVRVAASPAKVAPGGHSDIVITYKNMKKAPLSLDFMLDPTPRFSVEAYDAKGGKRVDMPPGHEPAPPKDATDKPASPQSTGRVTIAPGGSAHVRIGWDAVRTKWAPEKYKGTPPEMGYPRAPNGPLGKGKYQLHVVTPLINVLEGTEHEVTAPHLDIEVGH
jgi:hypothetical protein